MKKASKGYKIICNSRISSNKIQGLINGMMRFNFQD